MSQNLDLVKTEFISKLSSLTKEADVLNLKADYLGKTGVVSELLKSLKDLSAEEKNHLALRQMS